MQIVQNIQNIVYARQPKLLKMTNANAVNLICMVPLQLFLNELTELT